MHDKCMTVLADIGGTYARFAVVADNAPMQIKKYKAADFENLQSALETYCSDQNLEPGGKLRIATAGYEDGGVWKFVNQNKWILDPDDLKNTGWDAETILNDFEAATWALLNLECGDTQTFKGGDGASDTRCLLGPGTGLGLGYLHGNEKPHVQKTHGGHVPAAAITQEQWGVIKFLQDQQDGAVVFENIVSGPGLQKLQAQYDEETALRLFHEFYALFSATCVVAGNAYGGLYLTGGVMESLVANNQFDFDLFENWFCFDAVDSVKRDLQATPIVHITDPYPALKGLIHA